MKIAVVGSGASGLAATWLLNEYSDHEVHLYDSDSRTGGHANTVHFTPPNKRYKEGVDVDTGFIVCNPSTYPNFLCFLKKFPAIEILPTEMTFSVSRDNGFFEWAGSNLATIFCQPSRLVDPSMWRLIYDVLRFNACARRLITGSKKDADSMDLSIGQYLEREGYSDSFRDNYLIPMTAAIWSTPPDKCSLDFPARTLIQFLSNHHLLQITGKPSWLTLKGGSRVYVDSITSSLPPHHLHLSAPVESLSTSPKSPKVTLKTSTGETTEYDHVVLACHSDTALSILNAGAGVTTVEQKILGRFKWSTNEAVLHADDRLMPRSRLAWSCWNYLTTSIIGADGKKKANINQVALTYGMNDLQHLPQSKHGPVLVTLNPPFSPAPELVVGRYTYAHPILDADAIRSQEELPDIQGKRRITYAGAWTKYGFHEDGFTSGLSAVLHHIPNVSPPFTIEYPDREPELHWLLALFFDVFEMSGGRAVVGAMLAVWLAVVRVWLSGVFNLDHIGVE